MTFVPSQTDLFPACVQVLDAELTPLHYRDLTMKAVRLLKLNLDDVQMFRAIEDVRERLPITQKHGVLYTGAPLCFTSKIGFVYATPIFTTRPKMPITGEFLALRIFVL